eukprot:TRINITY_DN3165_c0_g1_i1.p1 TRINITY_DN3165_c0_g1~~TRINITY_DN3165_c0_g1_i1.p1  ORF type:complete len:580 (-),score=105.25 TRINITY_DN3165_c0_g1_i1:146-1885(-)
MEKLTVGKGTQIKAFAEVKQSPVLLVVVYPKNVIPEPDDFYAAFVPFGKILRILIFERGVATKAFIEYDSIEKAALAKTQLEGQAIIEEGMKASIFFANIDKIVFKSNSLGGKEYTQPEDSSVTAKGSSKTPFDSLRAEIHSKIKFKGEGTAENFPMELGFASAGCLGRSKEGEENDEEALIDQLLENALKESQLKVPEPLALSGKIIAGLPTLNSMATKSTLGTGPATEVFNDQFKGSITSMDFVQVQKRLPPGLPTKASFDEPTRRPNPFIRRNLSDSSSFHEDGDPTDPNPSRNFDYGTGGYHAYNTNATEFKASSGLFPSFPNQEYLDEPYEEAPIQDFPNYIDAFAPPFAEPMPPMPLNFADVGFNFMNVEHVVSVQTDHRSPVVYVKGFDSELVNVTMIYNIFSNFGNVEKIMYMRAKGIALIEFETIDYASIAREYLNNITLLDNPLRIYFSKYDSLVLRSNPPEGADEETFIGSPAMNRFRGFKSISINPASTTLHVSNLVIFCCKDEIIRNLFSPFGEIEALKFLFHENNRNMCLVRFSNLQDSIWALANLHNYDLGGRKIQISFTRSKV